MIKLKVCEGMKMPLLVNFQFQDCSQTIFSIRLKNRTHKIIIFLVLPEEILPPSTSKQHIIVLSHSHHDKEFHCIC
jgi:hypothetical protein